MLSSEMRHSAGYTAFTKTVDAVMSVSREEMQRREAEYRAQVDGGWPTSQSVTEDGCPRACPERSRMGLDFQTWDPADPRPATNREKRFSMSQNRDMGHPPEGPLFEPSKARRVTT
jgi:hypothetical protein